MPEMQDVKIGDAKGKGYAEIYRSGSMRHCHGEAYFETTEEVSKADDAYVAGEALYQGVVYYKGKATIKSFPVIITNLEPTGGALMSLLRRRKPLRP